MPESNYERSGRFSKAWLGWLWPIISLARLRTLDHTDLEPLSHEFKVSPLFSIFDGSSSSATSLMWQLYCAFGHSLLLSGVLKFVGDCAAMVTPKLVGFLLQAIEKKDINLWMLHGWEFGAVLTAGIFLLQSLNTVTVNLYFQRTMLSGFKARTALTEAMYRKALRLSARARREFPPSKVVNLTSIDAPRIDLAVGFIHYLWSGPFQTIVIMLMLYYLIGWTAFVGLGLFIAFFPVQNMIVKRISSQRKKNARFTDKRMKLMSELIHGVKIIKLHCWEDEFERRISELRASELENVQQIQLLQAVMATITSLVPVIACIMTFLIYNYVNGKLEIDIVLPALAYFNLLRLPLVLLPIIIGFVTDAKVSLTRIEEFLNAEELEDRVEDPDDPKVAIDIRDALFQWSTSTSNASSMNDLLADSVLESSFTLNIPCLTVRKGELVCVAGPIGSGKSSLIHSLLSDMNLVRGRLCIDKTLRIAYCPQNAWIVTGTLRENIIFGHPFDEDLYERVLCACQLTSDIDSFPAGDQTTIGERGVNLSGGQKQRVSLARAAYSQAEVYLLDDPLSALDAKVANAVWDECINGVMASGARLLVTHSTRHIENSGLRVLNFDNGTFTESVSSALPDGRPSTPVTDLSSKTAQKAARTVKKDRAGEEERQTGSISQAVIAQYLRYFGGSSPSYFVVTCLAALALNQASKIASDYWLSSHSSATASTTTVVFGAVYGGTGVLQGITILFVCLLFNSGGLAAARRLHNGALKGIMAAPLTFFESNATGRILARFGKDVDAADNQLPECIRSVFLTAFQVLSTVAVLIFTSPWSIVVIVPVVALFTIVQYYFRPPARDIKRLDALTKAPIFSHISESLMGVPTIRAYRHQERFVHLLEGHVDSNNQAVFLFQCLQRWAALRLEMVGNLVILAACSFGLAFSENYSFAGLAIIYAMGTTGSLNWLIRRLAEAETQLIATERLYYYENCLGLDGTCESVATVSPVPSVWPTNGAVEFDHLVIGYLPDRPPALKSVTFTIPAGQHVGIVGRTGAGKSTIVSAFFRLYPYTDGTIRIDGVDLRSIRVHEMRRRIAVIPQDPVIFAGTLRLNLDPFEEHDDHSLWTALDQCGLADTVRALPDHLDTVLEVNGENLSAGQRQLVCMARALLTRSAVTLMDEATSSVDAATDALIQKCIAREFAGRTVITVAHRLDTIMGYDRVIVLSDGYVIEDGSPALLARDHSSHFYELLQHQLVNSLGKHI